MGALSGGKTDGIDFGSLLSIGADVFVDGKVDMNDLINLASGGSSSSNTGAGGMFGNLLIGLFGKK